MFQTLIYLILFQSIFGMTPKIVLTTNTAGILSQGVLVNWGRDTEVVGILGHGYGQGDYFMSPRPFDQDLYNITDFAIGINHACFIDESEGSLLYCWGSNQYGTILPNGDLDSLRFHPIIMVSSTMGTAIEDILMVEVGDMHTCVVLKELRIVQCWGSDNVDGQLGSGSAYPSVMKSELQPIYRNDTEDLLMNVHSIYSEGNTTCTVDTSKHLFCWGGLFGGNSAQLVSSQVDEFKLSRTHGCFRSENSVFCWDGANTTVEEIQFSESEVVSIIVGNNFTCAILGSETRRLECMGIDLPLNVSGVVSGDAENDICLYSNTNQFSCFGDPNSPILNGLNVTDLMIAFNNLNSTATPTASESSIFTGRVGVIALISSSFVCLVLLIIAVKNAYCKREDTYGNRFIRSGYKFPTF